MKKTNKIIVALNVLLIVLILGTNIFAAQIQPSQLIGGTANPNAVTGLTNIGKQIVSIVQTVGVVVAVVILLVLGVKYLMGSAEEKAEYKKSMIPYIIGAILIFAATTVVNIVYNFANGLNTNS